MTGKLHKMWVRATLAVQQNKLALGFVFAWLAGNYTAFVTSFGMTKGAALLATFCVAKATGGYASAYQSFTEVVVFGVVASLVLTNLTRHYNPKATCRALASRASGHTIVIGYTNLGKRVHDLVRESDRAIVVVEEKEAEVEALVRDEAPLVVGSPRDWGVLEDAGIAKAKVVVIATDDFEDAAVACRLVREANASCELVVRCFDDDVGAILARAYRARAVSTSKLAGAYVLGIATNARSKAVVVIGKNNVGTRVAEALAHKRIPTSFIDATEDVQKLEAAGVAQADMVVVCDDDLGKNLVRVDRIRDLNKRARIICRAFHDDAAEILRRPPFECTVLSTSRHAANALVKAGAFREIGIDEAPAKLAVPDLATA